MRDVLRITSDMICETCHESRQTFNLICETCHESRQTFNEFVRRERVDKLVLAIKGGHVNLRVNNFIFTTNNVSTIVLLHDSIFYRQQ